MNFAHYRTMPLIMAVVLLWTIGSWVLSFLSEYEIVRGIGPLSIVIVALYLYDRLLWKKWSWKFSLLNVLVNIPNLNGTYQGEVEYETNDKNRKEKCELTIRQSASYIKIRCAFVKAGVESDVSTSKEVLFTRDGVGSSLLFYYQNKDNSTPDRHSGFSRLEVIQAQGNIRLEGYYFSNDDPASRGHMIVTRIPD